MGALRKVIFLSLAPFVLLTCKDRSIQEPIVPPSVWSVVVTPASSTLLLVGATRQLAAQARDSADNVVFGVSFTWTSSDTTKVRVSTTGLVTAVANGSATIIATASTDFNIVFRRDRGSATVTVAMVVAAVLVAPVNPTLFAVGATRQLTAQARDSANSLMNGVSFTWTSSDTTKLRVSATGLVTAVVYGSATIAATASGSGVSGSTTVTVRQNPSSPTARISAASGFTCGLTAGGVAFCWGDNRLGYLGNGTFGRRGIPVAVAGGLSFQTINAGSSSSTTCGLATGGVAYCWGDGGAGQLGNGSAGQPSETPTPVLGGLSFQSISTGYTHVCGITTGGAAYCWGSNYYGQLADGGPIGGGNWRTTPALVLGSLTFQSFTAAYHYTCGLTTGGAAYCWGLNSSGQLGDGTTTNRSSPVAVNGDLTFQALSTGYAHTCGLTMEGVVYCWGRNAEGQLGDGTTVNHTSPVVVSGGLTFQTISAGLYHTCGITAVGAAYCWGNNSVGQLGDGTTNDRLSPVAVAGGPTFSALSAGSAHTCALAVGGAAYCWGSSDAGALGDGSYTDRSSPVAVAGNLALQTLSTRSDHTCGLTTAGAAYCWGRGLDLQLGNGSTGRDRGGPVAVSGGLSFQAVTAGYNHTCGLSTSGAAYCWGDNYFGELGRGGTAGGLMTLGAVTGNLLFQSLSAGHGHTCGVSGGAAYCWGVNYDGELGDYTTVDRTSPVAVSVGLTFQTISASYWHTCGLTTGGAAYCWGANYAGQLGDGTTSRRLYPVAVAGGLTFKAVSAGYEHSCGLTTSGAAYCWGSNLAGQLGDGTASLRLSPVAVSGGQTFQTLSAGYVHTCGLATSGAAYCWGSNGSGQLGDGTTVDHRSPVATVGGLTFQALSAGGGHSCGLTASAAAYCWGANGSGQLGDSPATPRTSPGVVVGGIVFGSSGVTPSPTSGGGIR